MAYLIVVLSWNVCKSLFHDTPAQVGIKKKKNVKKKKNTELIYLKTITLFKILVVNKFRPLVRGS